MNATTNPVAARELAIQLEHLSLRHVDGVMRLANAERMVRLTLDDLTDARSQIDAQKERLGEMSIALEASCDESTTKRIRLDKIAHDADLARELIMSGRVNDGMKVLRDLIDLARSK